MDDYIDDYQTNNRKPDVKFRLGSITAAVWRNDQNFYGVTLQKSYKEGDTWKNTQSLSHGDLLNAAKVLERAENYIARNMSA
jgi:hypothetical protein